MGSRARQRIGRLGALRRIGRLGDGEFFDYGAQPDPAIPADQMDWSGDYAIQPSGAWTGAAVYGDTGDQYQWNWTPGAEASTVQVINAATPPDNPFSFGIDPNKLVQTAQGVYKYVQKLNPKTGQQTLSPVKVANANGTPVSTAAMSPVIIGGGFLLALAILKG